MQKTSRENENAKRTPRTTQDTCVLKGLMLGTIIFCTYLAVRSRTVPGIARKIMAVAIVVSRVKMNGVRLGFVLACELETKRRRDMFVDGSTNTLIVHLEWLLSAWHDVSSKLCRLKRRKRLRFQRKNKDPTNQVDSPSGPTPER
jgi:hypothetical protein